MSLPVFDYDGSLELARELVVAATETADHASTRMASRDTALDPATFQGPYGDHHRALAATEDMDLTPLVEACRERATGWANAWADAVNEHNEIRYEEARNDMRRANDGRRDRHRLLVLNDPEGHHQLDLGSVERPKSISPPAGDAFTVEASFVHYVSDGHDLRAEYRTGP